MEHLSVVAIQLSANQCANGCSKSLPTQSACLMTWMTLTGQSLSRTCNATGIGKSTGANVTFKVKGTDKEFTVFTTRPDYSFGATFTVLAPEHELVDAIVSAEQAEAVADYKHQASLKSDLARTDLAKEKTGVWTGAYAINPVNGKEIPIWIADYVLSSYGTGAVMAVSAHDQRDWEFAKQFDLPIVGVLEGGNV